MSFSKYRIWDHKAYMLCYHNNHSDKYIRNCLKFYVLHFNNLNNYLHFQSKFHMQNCMLDISQRTSTYPQHMKCNYYYLLHMLHINQSIMSNLMYSNNIRYYTNMWCHSIICLSQHMRGTNQRISRFGKGLCKLSMLEMHLKNNHYYKLYKLRNLSMINNCCYTKYNLLFKATSQSILICRGNFLPIGSSLKRAFLLFLFLYCPLHILNTDSSLEIYISCNQEYSYPHYNLCKILHLHLQQL